MCEIKFRGRVKNTNKPQWVYGIVIPLQYSSWEDWTLFDGERRWIVDPETVGQFTGICDSYGKEIYEGDILKDLYDKLLMVVVYGDYSKVGVTDRTHIGFFVEFVGKEAEEANWAYRHDLGYWIKSSSVIGNRFDNSELLKVGEDDEYLFKL